MSHASIMAGTYGRLTVIGRAQSPLRALCDNRRRNAWWVFDCACGNKVVRNGVDVRRGRTTSCGCVRRENSVEMRAKRWVVRQIVADQGVDRIARNGVSSIAETAAKAENANASRRQPEGVTLNQIGAELTRPTGIPNPVLAENLRSVNAGGMPYE